MAALFPITQMIDRRKIGFRVLSGQGANIDNHDRRRAGAAK
jgi:hypothetical protein